MSSKVKQSQSRHSASKFINTASRSFDPLVPRPHEAVGAPVVQERIKLDITSRVASAGGTNLTVRLPSTQYIGECYLLVGLDATGAGNFADYPGLQTITRCILRSQETCQEFDYRVAMDYCLSKMSNQKKQALLALAGGTGSGSSKTVVTPLPFFWSKLTNGHHAHSPPFAAHLLDQGMECELTFQTVANLLASGASGSAINSVELVCMTWDTSDQTRARHFSGKASYVYKGIDFQTNQTNPVADDITTKIDISSFHGDSRELGFAVRLQSDIDTSHNVYDKVQDGWDEQALIIDGSEYNRVRSYHELSYENLIQGHEGDSLVTGLNGMAFIPFSIDVGTLAEGRDWSGAYNMSDANTILFEIKKNAGAAMYVDFINVVNAVWSIENGHLKRNL